MVGKKHDNEKSKKRKSQGATKEKSISRFKQRKLAVSGSMETTSKKATYSTEQEKLKQFKFAKANNGQGSKMLNPKRLHRLRAKELVEARKKKRRQHYSLEKELVSLWETMRRRNIAKEERENLISKAILKMKGKIPEIAVSHISSRVLQTCVKYCKQSERDAIFNELKPRFLALATNSYAVHLVMKMLDNASKKQLEEFIISLIGHVASLLRHMVGSVVVEHAYQLANATQKQQILLELYFAEFRLFQGLSLVKERTLSDLISSLDLQKPSVLRHMASVIQPILEKGVVDHSLIHKVLIEYLSIADKSSAADVVQQLSGPLLVRMIHTKDGSRVGVLCVKHGNSKQRKKIIKGMKGHVGKIACDQYGSMVLSYIISTIDDTKLLAKFIVQELQKILTELVFDKNGRRPLLQLLHPYSSCYFSPDDMVSFSLHIPSLYEKQCDLEKNTETETLKKEESHEDDKKDAASIADHSEEDGGKLVEHGKKDPYLRRCELLIDGGLAENLVDLCIENVGELLRSKFGKEVLYEVATGGSGVLVHQNVDEKMNKLHEAVASLVAEPKSDVSTDEHILENFHSTRTIRKLVLGSSAFAVTLWVKALAEKCRSWVHGHSSKVLCAFLESSDAKIRELCHSELQVLVDEGVLICTRKQSPDEAA